MCCAVLKSLSRVRLFVTPWTVAYQAPLSLGILQEWRILKWVAISFSRASSQPKNRTGISCIAVTMHGYDWATSLSLSCIGEGNGNPLQCSCLENPRDGEPGGLPSMGSHRVGHDWSDLAAAATMPLLHLSYKRAFALSFLGVWIF